MRVGRGTPALCFAGLPRRTRRGAGRHRRARPPGQGRRPRCPGGVADRGPPPHAGVLAWRAAVLLGRRGRLPGGAAQRGHQDRRLGRAGPLHHLAARRRRQLRPVDVPTVAQPGGRQRRAAGREARTAHDERDRGHPPRPARRARDARAGPPAVRRAVAAARRLRAGLRRDRPPGGRAARDGQGADPPRAQARPADAERHRMTRTRWATALAATALLAGLTACSGDDSSTAAPSQDKASEDTAPSDTASEPAGGVVDLDLEAAAGDPLEDSVYPDVGDPSVDALHYDLDVAWDPEARTLTGEEELTFRSTGDADHVQLDLIPQLEVSAVEVDGKEAEFEHAGKNLVVSGDFVEGDQYELSIDYSGTPQPVEAPTTRADFSTTGFTVTEDGSAWTMQEPYGAYSWFAVNDQPSDKAFHDFPLRPPPPFPASAHAILTRG